MQFGEKLRELRRKNHLTQAELADILKISLRALVYYENNHRFPPRETLILISDYFNVEISFLIDDNYDQEKPSANLSPSELLNQIGSLLAGGSLSETDKDKFIQALTELQNEVRERNRDEKTQHQ